MKSIKVKTKLLFFIIFLGIANTLNAQEYTLSGKVTDIKTKEPIIGASVSVKGTHTGTITDLDGSFLLKSKEKLPATLDIRMVGYKSQEVDVYQEGSVNIELNEGFNKLDEIVVIGYGTQKRSDLTGSITSVPQASLEQATSSFDNALSGSVPGVNVTQSSGQPGASSSIRIRGGNSINGGNEPLYVIDGFIIYNDNESSGGINALATINPADIETIDVLKDASATAIYGSRGANGVIIITTKKGKNGSDKVIYRGSYGWQNIRKKLNLLNGAQWESLRNDIEASLGNSASFTNDEIAKIGNGYNWQDEALQNGILQNHQVSISGGDIKSRYSISGNYFSQEGILRNTSFDRYTARINYDRDISKKFKIGLNAFGSHSKQTGVATSSIISLLQMSPATPIYNEDGSFNYSNPYATTIINGATANLISDLENTTNATNVNRTFGNFFAEYKLIPSLAAKINVGTDLINTKKNYYAPSYTSGGLGTSGSASVTSRTVNSWQAEFTLNYEKSFNDKHFVNILAGYTTQKTDGEYAKASATNFLNDVTTYNSLQSGSASLPESGSYTSVLNSYLGRINYSFLHRYNFTASLRADGSSRFSKNNKWGYFPSVGFSWNINDESFLKNNKTISSLKLRLSAGATGNQEIGDYQYLSLLTPINYSFDGTIVTGYATSNLANPDLKWEKTVQYDAGIDLGLWKDRVNITFDIYDKKTSNLLLNVPVPTTTGYSSVLKNIGAVSNKGIEIGITADVIKGKGKRFNWNTSLVFATNKNEVTSLGDDVDQFFPTIPNGTLTVLNPIIVKKGEPLGSFWGYETDGIVQTGDDLTKVAKPSWISGSVQAGDRKYKNQNDDAVINSSDRKILGNAQPKFTYGVTNTFTYKNFDLAATIQGSYGNKIYNALKEQLEITTLGTNSLATIADRWTTTNPSNDIPRATSSPVAVVTDRLIEDGSYVRLKTLSIGYTLPIKFTGSKDSKIRAYLTGQNLFTITKYTGYDPEVSTYEQNSLYQGVDYGAYPSSKSYSFGVEITF